MNTLIDEKLDEFMTKGSKRFFDQTLWGEMFELASLLEKTDVNEYNYQIKRFRDLKNTIDYYRELGIEEGRQSVLNKN